MRISLSNDFIIVDYLLKVSVCDKVRINPSVVAIPLALKSQHIIFFHL